jgi:hypothetical protein
VISKPENQRGFVAQAKRWVVERTFAWLGRNRQLSKEYDGRPESTEAWIYLASIDLLLKRLHPSNYWTGSKKRTCKQCILYSTAITARPPHHQQIWPIMSEYIMLLVVLSGVLTLVITLLPNAGHHTATDLMLKSLFWWYKRTPQGTTWTIPGLERLQSAILSFLTGIWALGRNPLIAAAWAALKCWLGL